MRVRSNLELSHATLALKEANQLLESKVRERTAQLHHSHSALMRTMKRARPPRQRNRQPHHPHRRVGSR